MSKREKKRIQKMRKALDKAAKEMKKTGKSYAIVEVKD